jgi:hypothetical protein
MASSLSATAVELRPQQIRLRRAEITAELAAAKHRFIAHGQETPFAHRTALEAEFAALGLEALQIANAAKEANARRRVLEDDSLLNTLVRLLEARGMGGLVAEARAASDAAVAAAGGAP